PTPAEAGRGPVEPGGRLGRNDEELGAVGVGPGVGHRQRPPDQLAVVDLVAEVVAGAAGAGALGAAALDHEVADHAVEDGAVVEALPRQADEVADGLGGRVGPQLKPDLPGRGVDHGGVAGVLGGGRWELWHRVLSSSLILAP